MKYSPTPRTGLAALTGNGFCTSGEVVGYAFAELLPGVRNTKLSGRDKMSAPSRRRYTPGIKVALSESIGFILPIKQEVCTEECQRSEYC